jgi:glutamyl-tRNA synthetase
LHLGHARTFLIAWWHARARGGRVLMRLEDLDGPRSRPEFCDAALRDLEWLGLDWDGAPYLQSTGRERITRAARQLEERGFAYACICSRGDVARAQRAPQLGDVEPRYPGTCRGRFASSLEARQSSGKAPGLRLRVPPGSVHVDDGFAGNHAYDVQASVGDFLIEKRDAAPAYQLAVVVDDAQQGVTEVVRGDDLLPSAARQRLLQEALGLPRVRWFHVPLVLSAEGRRFAKRENALSLTELRESGTDARAIVSWAACSLGMQVEPRERPADVLARFDLKRLSRTPYALSEEELARLRAQRI